MDPGDEFPKPSFVAQTGQVGTAKHLVKKVEADAEDKSSKKVPATTVKAAHGSNTRHCFENAGEDNAKDKLGKPSFVPQTGHVGTAQYLFDKVNDEDAKEKTRGETSHFAGKTGRAIGMRPSLGRKEQLEELHGSTERGDLDHVKRLVQRGAPLSEVDFYGQTALGMAAKTGHVDIVKCLVKNGAHVNQVSKVQEWTSGMMQPSLCTLAHNATHYTSLLWLPILKVSNNVDWVME